MGFFKDLEAARRKLDAVAQALEEVRRGQERLCREVEALRERAGDEGRLQEGLANLFGYEGPRKRA